MAESTDAAMITLANVIKNETGIARNTKTRIADLFLSINYSKSSRVDGTVWIAPDAFDASGNVFPDVGVGNGDGGVILRGNTFDIGVAGVLGGVAVFPGMSCRALVDEPTNDIADWKINQG